MAYTRYSSLPSLIASLGIGSAMMISGMRIRDGMDYGYEGAAGESESCFGFRGRRERGWRGMMSRVVSFGNQLCFEE